MWLDLGFTYGMAMSRGRGNVSCKVLSLTCAMFVCLDLDYVCHTTSYCSPFVTLSFFIVFWPIGLDLI